MMHPSGLNVEHLPRFSGVRNGAASYAYKDLSVELVRAFPNVILCQMYFLYVFATGLSYLGKNKTLLFSFLRKKSKPLPQSNPLPQTTLMSRAQNTVTEYFLYYFHPQGIDII